jgi:formylglycine-generating enzyme required for sulfatase activity
MSNETNASNQRRGALSVLALVAVALAMIGVAVTLYRLSDLAATQREDSDQLKQSVKKWSEAQAKDKEELDRRIEINRAGLKSELAAPLTQIENALTKHHEEITRLNGEITRLNEEIIRLNEEIIHLSHCRCLGLLPGEKVVDFEYVMENEHKWGTCRVLTLEIGGGESMELVRISKGRFTMGSPKEEKEPESYDEQHEVEITKDFYLGRYTVTQAQYRRVTGQNPSRFRGDRLPVEQVSWEDADAYCKALSKKLGRKVVLPSEAQWEYACRAGTRTPFYFGSKLNGDLANCNGNYPCGTEVKGAYKTQTTEVGSYPANPGGLYDMSGNVWQWCEDWYGPYSKVEGNRDPLQLIKQSGNFKACRGGSCFISAQQCRSAYRGFCKPDYRSDNISYGFRVLLSLEK